LKKLVLLTLIALLAGCSREVVSDQQLAKVLDEHPELILKAIEKNPEKVLDALNKAMENKRTTDAEKQQKAQLEERENEFKNPKKPRLAVTDNYRGAKDAQITIVEYSDFQCSFCAQAYGTVEKVMNKYEGKVKLVYKHLPLTQIHPQAMLASQYFLAIEKQSKEKAWKFYDELFKNQGRMNEADTFFNEVAKASGVDLNKLAKDLNSEQVKNKIAEDMKEAQAFGFNGTPAFLINGVSLVGAQPVSEFSAIIDRHLKEG